MLYKRFQIYISCWICFFLGLQGQNTIIKNFGVSEGLPSSECYYVIQDSHRCLWIATDAGVAKYDGYTFKSYNTSHGLPDNTVFKIHEDRFGRIWFSTYSGKMAYYSYQTDAIHTIQANQDLAQTIKIAPVDFCFDERDTLWLSSQHGGYIKVLPPHYKTIKRFTVKDNGHYLKAVTKQGFIYGFQDQASNRNKNLLYLPLLRPMVKKHFGKHIFNFSSRLSALQIAKDHYLLATSAYVFNLKGQTLNEIFNSGNQFSIISIYRDSKHRIWMCTDKKGVFIFKNDSFINPIRNLLPDATVSSVCEDTEHGFWLTSTNKGLNYFPNLDFEFYDAKHGISSNKVYNIAIVNTKLYANLDNTELFSKVIGKADFQLMPHLNASYLFGYSNGIVTRNSNSTLFDTSFKNPNCIYFKVKKNILVLKQMVELDQQFLLGFDMSSNVYRINKITGEAEYICQVPAKVLSLCVDGAHFYIGTKVGLYHYKNNQLHYLGTQNPQLTNRIEALLLKNNSLFIATKGLGVLQYESGKIINHWHEGNGLISNICKCLVIDELNSIWVGTNKGLSRLIENKQGKFYCSSDHLLNGAGLQEINQMLVHKDKLYLASNSGLGIFNLKTQVPNQHGIPVYIENTIVKQKKVDSIKLKSLNYNENTIEIYFKAIDLKSKGSILYKYKLVGLEKDWSYTKNTSVRYTELDPGLYTFLVMPANNHLNHHYALAFVQIKIHPAFWQTWWFQISVLLSLSAISYWRYKRRIKKIENTAKQQTLIDKKIANSELKALRAQMNPHFIFNAMNSIQSFILKNEGLTAQKYLTKFSKLMRFVLEHSKGDAILLSKEIEALTLYVELEILRANFSFDFTLEIENQLKQMTLYIPPMLIQPYVENAIIHGLRQLTERKGHLRLGFKLDNGALVIEVEDNGIGRAKAKMISQQKKLDHESMGLQVTQDRILQLNQSSLYQIKIEITDHIERNISLGTLVKLEIKN